MYNFKGYIGLPVENIANTYFKKNNINIAIHSDDIETGALLTQMAFMLYHKYSNSKEVLAFLKKYKDFLGETGVRIPENDAISMLKDFKSIFYSDEREDFHE